MGTQFLCTKCKHLCKKKKKSQFIERKEMGEESIHRAF